MSEANSTTWGLDAVGSGQVRGLAQNMSRVRVSIQQLQESLSAARTQAASGSITPAVFSNGHSECIRLIAFLDLLSGIVETESIARFRSMIDLLQKRLREVADCALVQNQLQSLVVPQSDSVQATEWQKLLQHSQAEFAQRSEEFWTGVTPQSLQELRDLAEIVISEFAEVVAQKWEGEAAAESRTAGEQRAAKDVSARTSDSQIVAKTAASQEQSIQHYEVELRMLRKLGVICSEATTEDELLERATVLIADTLSPDNCGFLLLDKERRVLVTHPSFVLSDPTVSRSDKALGVGITGQVAQTGIARRVGDVSLEPGYLAADSRTRSELCLPMKISANVVGVLNVESAQPNAFSKNDERLASTVVDLVGNALERLRLEQSGRESEQYFALFMQHLPGLAWIKDDRGRYVFANATAEDVFGIPLSQLSGKTDDELFSTETAALFKENDSRALKSATEIRTIEQLKHKDGIVHQSIVSKFSLPHFNGNSLYVGGVAIDITEHILAEENARKVSVFREAIVRMAAEGICVCHAIPEFPYVSFLVWNERMTEMTGYTMEEINRLGWYQSMYPDPEVQQRAINRMSQMREGNDMRAEEWEITRKDGAQRIVSISTSIVEMEENAVCVMAVMLDITERKQAERKLRMMQFSVDKSSDAIFWVAPDARILYANEAATLRLGYSNDELLQRAVFDFDPDFPETAWPAHWAELKQRGSMVFESRHQTKDGHLRDVEINANYVNFDGLEFNFASTRDITVRKKTEESLRFALFSMDRVADAIFWVDGAGRILYANEAASRLLGYTCEELTAKFFSDIDPRVPQEHFAEAWEQLIRQKTLTVETSLLTRDRRLVEVEITSNLISYDGRDLNCAMARDITERKRTEKSLRDSEARYRLISGLASSFSYQATITADHHLVFEWVSGKFEEVMGCSPHELTGLGWLSLIPAESMPWILERIAGLRSRGSQLADPLEVKIQNRAGEIRWLRSVVHVEFPNEPNETLTILGTALDITARKQTEEVLQKMQFSVDHAGDSIFWADPDGRFLYVNRVAADSRGYSQDELLCLTVFDLDSGLNADLWKWHFEDLKQRGNVRLESQHRAKDGRVFPVEIDASYVQVGDQEFSFVSVRDISERKQFEQSLTLTQFSIDRAADSVFWVAPNAEILYVNDAACRTLGYSREEMVGKTVHDIDPNFPASAWPAHWKELQERKSFTFESDHQTKDGSVIQTEVTVNHIEFLGREYNCAMMRDITVRKRQEALLRGQNQVLEMIASNAQLEDTLTVLLRHIEAQSPEMLCSILLTNDAGTHLYHGASPSLPDEYSRAIDGVPIGPTEGSCGTAAFRLEPVIVEEIERDPLWTNYRDAALRHHLHACWSVPIVDARNQLLGTFAVYYRYPCLPTDRDWELINIAIRSAAIAIAQRREQIALQESEERFKSFMDQSPVVAWIKDEEFRFRYANAALGQLFRTDASEVLGRTDYDLYDEEKADITRANDRIVLESGKTLEAIEQVPGADGRMRSWLVQKFPLNRTGKPTWTGGTAVDVTARRDAENALRDSESRFRQLVDASPNAILMVSEDGAIVFSNRATERMLGYPSAELVGLDVEVLIPERFREGHKELRREYQSHPVARPMGVGKVLSARRKDGSEVPVEIGLAPIQRADVIYILATVTDITIRNQAEEALRESEKRFRLIFEGANDAIFWADAKSGLLVNCNPAAERLVGRNRAEIIGKSQSILHPPEQLEQSSEAFRQHASARVATPLELEVIHKNGSRIDVSISPSVTVIAGTTIVQGIFRDISERKKSERLLRESEERFQAFMNQSPIVAWVKDENFRIRYVNEPFKRIFNLTESELLGKTDYEYLPKETADELRSNDVRVLQTETPLESIERTPGPDGRSRIWLVQKFPLKRSGQKTWVGGTAIDVTDRTEAELAMRESERRLSFALENSQIGAWGLNQDGTATYRTLLHDRIFGYETLLPKWDLETFFNHVLPEDRAEVARIYQTARTSMTDWNFECRIRRADGEVRWIWAAGGHELPNDYHNGRISGIVRDITDRKNAQEALRERETLLRTLTDHAQVGMVMVNAEHKYVFANASYLRLLAIPMSDIIGLRVEDVLPTVYESQIRPRLNVAFTGEQVSYELVVPRPHPEEPEHWFSVTYDPVLETRYGPCVIVVIVDITERKAIEVELSLRRRDMLHASRLNAIGQMVAGLSHEVAQPLSAISNFASASRRLLESFDENKLTTLQEYLQTIADQSRRCAAILRRLRDFSRRTPTQKSECDLNQLLMESFELVSPEMRRNGVRICMELCATLPMPLVDRVQIQQVVINLLTNALDAVRNQMPENRQVTIRSNDEVEFAVFEVEDTGSGIAPEIAKHLFEPFFTTKGEGMGIGLNICETIVRDHGGTIEVVSNEFGGATFRVRLPLHLNGDIRAILQ